jgi:hypothetical protein
MMGGNRRLGGGTTSFQCGLDVYYHAIMSSDLQKKEQIDFNEQQLARPWKVPTRERQTIVTDVCVWWATFPHASKGREALRRTACALLLPPMEKVSSTAKDGSYVPAEFSLVGPEDHLVALEAKDVWQRTRMPEVRAQALSEVQRDFEQGRIGCAEDLWQYLRDESEPENEEYEGVETVITDAGNEDDSDADAEPDNGDDWDGDGVPG